MQGDRLAYATKMGVVVEGGSATLIIMLFSILHELDNWAVQFICWMQIMAIDIFLDLQWK